MSLCSHSSVLSGHCHHQQHPLPLLLKLFRSFSPSLPEFSEDCSSVDVCSSSLPILVTDYGIVACAPTTHAQAPLHPLTQHDLVLSRIFMECQDVHSFGHLPLPSFLPCSRFFPYRSLPKTSTPHLEIQSQLFCRDPDPRFRLPSASISPGRHSLRSSDVATEINMLPTMATSIVCWFYLCVSLECKLVRSLGSILMPCAQLQLFKQVILHLLTYESKKKVPFS